MKALFEKLDAKSITQVITSFGGIVLAGYLVWFITAKMQTQLIELTSVIRQLNDTITSMQEKSNSVIERNTDVFSALISPVKAGNTKTKK